MVVADLSIIVWSQRQCLLALKRMLQNRTQKLYSQLYSFYYRQQVRIKLKWYYYIFLMNKIYRNIWHTIKRSVLVKYIFARKRIFYKLFIAVYRKKHSI